MRNSLRSSDFLGRLGGDEFAAIMPQCERAIAEQKAEIIRSRIEQLRFTWAEITLSIGVSIGYVLIDGSVLDIDKIQSMADEALYSAKRAGRNQVVFGGLKLI
jgi:diguanylate cyclase (GGDEF)-like protein